MQLNTKKNSIWIFWVFLVENWVSMFSKKNYSEKFSKNENFELFFVFFNKFMLSECFLAISSYFYTSKYPKKSTTATQGSAQDLKISVLSWGRQISKWNSGQDRWTRTGQVLPTLAATSFILSTNFDFKGVGVDNYAVFWSFQVQFLRNFVLERYPIIFQKALKKPTPHSLHMRFVSNLACGLDIWIRKHSGASFL
jgi:hypothetical protein